MIVDRIDSIEMSVYVLSGDRTLDLSMTFASLTICTKRACMRSMVLLRLYITFIKKSNMDVQMLISTRAILFDFLHDALLKVVSEYLRSTIDNHR